MYLLWIFMWSQYRLLFGSIILSECLYKWIYLQYLNDTKKKTITKNCFVRTNYRTTRPKSNWSTANSLKLIANRFDHYLYELIILMIDIFWPSNLWSWLKKCHLTISWSVYVQSYCNVDNQTNLTFWHDRDA